MNGYLAKILELEPYEERSLGSNTEGEDQVSSPNIIAAKGKGRARGAIKGDDII
jgi:hypothetical protein